MIEPTETETRETLDSFCDAMIGIAEEAKDPEMVHSAPHETALRRLDETRAARQPRLRWTPPEAQGAQAAQPISTSAHRSPQ